MEAYKSSVGQAEPSRPADSASANIYQPPYQVSERPNDDVAPQLQIQAPKIEQGTSEDAGVIVVGKGV